MAYSNIRQELTISGLDTPIFKQALKNTGDICAFFDEVFGENKLDDSHILKRQDGDLAGAIEVANRFFTPLKDAGPRPTSVPFKKGVDPQGHLAAMASDGEHIHMNDNAVYYCKRLRDMGGGVR